MEINWEEAEELYFRLQELLFPRAKGDPPVLVDLSDLDNIETSCTPSE